MVNTVTNFQASDDVLFFLATHERLHDGSKIGSRAVSKMDPGTMRWDILPEDHGCQGLWTAAAVPVPHLDLGDV